MQDNERHIHVSSNELVRDTYII